MELKSHDCHVLIQQLLVVAIRDILPNKARLAISGMCFLFNAICSKVLDPVKLDELENKIAKSMFASWFRLNGSMSIRSY